MQSQYPSGSGQPQPQGGQSNRFFPNNNDMNSFHPRQPSMSGLRDRGGAAMPAINTSRAGANAPGASETQTPGTAYDMNYTPLLPSNLLMGSPFQPNSPSTFQSPQFQSFGGFQHPGNGGSHQQQNNHAGSPISNDQQMSPMYQSMMSPGAFNGQQTYGAQPQFGGMAGGYGNNMNGGSYMGNSTRTIYLGNIPPDTPADEILNHVRSGAIESFRLLPDKNCAFVSFLDPYSAVHFHSDAMLKKLSVRSQEIKVGWGKTSQVPSSVAIAVQQSQASRNVYLGNLPPETTEDELRQDLGKFGPIDTVKLVAEKNIGFVHFLSISNALKAVTHLPQEPKWQSPKRVAYGKDRCAYVSKTQQQNAAQYLGIAPGYANTLNPMDRDNLGAHLNQQSFTAATVATASGGTNNVGNRTVYLGNIHPETTCEEICNVVRGGLLHHIRYIPDKHICFVTFIDPTSAASFFALSSVQGLMIHNRRLKIGWGKHSGPLPPAIGLSVSNGATRNVYIGNIDDTITEERLRQDFSEFGEVELVNTLREKSCAFVNFTMITNAIKAQEAMKDREDYRRFKINHGKDRCGNPPRHNPHTQGQAQQMGNGQDMMSPTINGPIHPSQNSQAGSSASHSNAGFSPAPMNLTNGATHQSMHRSGFSTSSVNANNEYLNMYLNQVSNQQSQEHSQSPPPFQPSGTGNQSSQYHSTGMSNGGMSRSNLEPPPTGYYPGHSSSNSFGGGLSGPTTHGGMLAPSDMNSSTSAHHNRGASVPTNFFGQPQQASHHHHGLSSNGLGGLGSGLGGLGAPNGTSRHGLAIQEDEENLVQ
ncbi:MAG: hypothetical protein M1831_003947 [Alyxoria varia]|nr:MAG: hypothetical protein M1831_003947 [Alyxoria varia]